MVLDDSLRYALFTEYHLYRPGSCMSNILRTPQSRTTTFKLWFAFVEKNARDNLKNIPFEQTIKEYNYVLLSFMVEDFTKSNYTREVRLQNIVNKMPIWIFRNHCLQLEAFKILKKSRQKSWKMSLTNFLILEPLLISIWTFGGNLTCIRIWTIDTKIYLISRKWYLFFIDNTHVLMTF